MTVPHARLIALILTAVAAAVVWQAPMYSGERSSTDASGRTLHESVRGRLRDVPGSPPIVAVGLPVVVALLPLILPRLKMSAGVLLLGFSILASMSIGLFYLPGAVLLLLPERGPRWPVS